MSTKILCQVCGFMVKPEGHAERCRPARVVVPVVDKRKAWIGDAIHRLDVRLAAQYMDVPHDSADVFTQTYVTNAAMREYLCSQGLDEPGSDARAGTKFESLYVGEFRLTYLALVFPSVCNRILEAWSPPQFCDT